MDANVKFMISVPIFIMIITFCTLFPINTETKNEILSAEQTVNKEKLGIKIDKERSGGWISTTSTNMTYSVIANNGNIMNKTMEINDDDIEYVKGDKNMIFYTVSKNILGKIVKVDNIIIEYNDKTSDVK